MNNGMYSINKEGNIIFIELDKPKKLAYYKDSFGLFNTEEEAKKEILRRQHANRWLKDEGYRDE